VYRLRKEQIDSLGRDLEERFAADAIEHLCRYFEPQCGDLDELRAVVHRTIERGHRYGLRSDRALLRLLNVTMVLGEDFDEVEQFRWAAEYLLDSAVPDAEERVALLSSEVLRRLRLREHNDKLRQEFYRGVG